jgi:outer membrane lipopolysaccharide assembly protein LptE/RlpB
MRATFKISLLLGLICTLAACSGWHLRGTGPGSAVGIKVFVKDLNAILVGRALRQQLIDRGALVVGSRANADITIEVIGERFSRRILSVDPDTGKVREIELILRSDFAMRGNDGGLLVPRETVDWQLDYVFDEISVLGTVEQDTVVRSDLAVFAATAIVLRMQAVKLADASEQPK